MNCKKLKTVRLAVDSGRLLGHIGRWQRAPLPELCHNGARIEAARVELSMTGRQRL